MWALCYPPFPLGPLGFAVLAPAFAATATLTERQAFRAWFFGGLASNTVMYWWIYHVMEVGPAAIVGTGLVLLIAFLSLFNGLLGWGFRTALSSPHRSLLLGLFPLAWAGLEVARAAGEMSFPWNNLGYTLGARPVLFQSVSWWGIYGLSALMVAANLLLFRALEAGTSPRPRRAMRWLAGFTAIPLLLAVHGAAVLFRADAEERAQPAVRLDISLVQPSIPQTKKWNEQYFAGVVGKTFRTLSGPQGDGAPVQGTDLIVLAETAIPDFLRSRPEIADSLRTIAAGAEAPLLVGALDLVEDLRPWSKYRFYNSAFLFSPRPAEPVRQYSKLRLVPFSEKLPFDGILPVLNYVDLGEGDFSPGDGHRIWETRGVRWAPSICYEVIYPSFVREARQAGAQLLVNITNDGWFGRSNGPYQHANIARFRAAENGMPVARSANNGVSVFYDAWGRDLGRTELMDSTVLRRSVPVPDRRTLYSRIGGGLDTFLLLALAGWIALAVAGAWRTKSRRTTLGS